MLWGGEFWTDGYYVSTVGQHGTEDTVRKYVQNQGMEKEYRQLHVQQLSLF
jgi:REP element-mobilizing transposase RayT